MQTDTLLIEECPKPAVPLRNSRSKQSEPSWPWVYLVAQLLAAVAAGFAFRALNPGD